MEVQYYNDYTYSVDNLLNQVECEEYITWSENDGYGEAPITTAFGPVMNKAVRNNERVILDDRSLAQLLYKKVKPFVIDRFQGMKAIGLNERFRFYRYTPGQYFNWHMDGAYRRNYKQVSLFTLMFYLNDDFSGGRTEFNNFKVHPQAGRALFFYHRQEHKGDDVLTGCKYVIRTDVMYELI